MRHARGRFFNGCTGRSREKTAHRVGHARGEGRVVREAPPVQVDDQRVRGSVGVVDPVQAERARCVVGANLIEQSH